MTNSARITKANPISLKINLGINKRIKPAIIKYKPYELINVMADWLILEYMF